ncbi:putative ribonuclease H-like domain-containing protein [Tanacetum coccineum]
MVALAILTGNKDYLLDYGRFYGGSMAFRSDPNRSAHEKPSESSPKDNDVQDTKMLLTRKKQLDDKKVTQDLEDELEKMKAAQATKTNILSTNRPSVSTDRPFVSTDRPSDSIASTPTGTNAGESSIVYLGGKIPIDASTLPNADLPIDPNMPNLEDASDTLLNDGIFNGTYDDDKDVGAVADFNNMDNIVEEGIDYDEVFAPVARIEAIRLFLAFASYMGFIVYQMDVKSAFLNGTIEEEVYVHQPPGFVDPAHPNKVYKVIKALYGLHQAPRAWYETLSSFLMENGFRRGTIDKTLFIKKKKSDIMLVQVYVDDIIFGSTKKSMCTEFEECMHKRFQMSSMGELTFFLGLQVKQLPEGIFISQDKYVADILKKFDFLSIRTATTPIESNKPLVKDEDGVDVDVHVYRSMIGSLMYLTASRPDIMFAVCACARFQVTPKASHLNAVKRIFRYLKHQPKLGLWYPRDSPFELEAYSDSDYGGASLDRKSTTGGCQFLGRRLISWQCKKQTIVANSTTEAEYVAAANCCGQVLWIQNQMMDYGFNFMNTKIHIDNESTISVIKNPVAHSRTKHIEIRFHFIRDCYEKRLIEVIKIHTDHNVADLLTKGFDVTRISMDLRMDRSWAANSSYSWSVSTKYALTHNPTIYDSLVKQFWQTATVRTLANGTQQLIASIDSTEYTITEASVRSKLQLANATRIHNLSDAEIYDGLATLGGYAGDFVPLLPSMLAGAAMDPGEGSAQPAEPHHTPVDPLPSTSLPPHSPHQSPPHSPHQSPPHSPHQSPPYSPPHYSPLRSYEAPLPEGNTTGSAEDSMQLKELMDIIPKLVTIIETLETELQQTKTTYGKAVLTLVKRVKILEKALKRKTHKVVISESEGEEPEDQGRII